MNKIKDACNSFTDDLKGQFYNLEELDEETKTALEEDHFIFK